MSGSKTEAGIPGWRPAIGHGAFAMADQLVVSGSRFLLVVLLARECGEIQLGIFALVISFVYMAQMCLQTLVTTPYANFCRRENMVDRLNYRDDCRTFALALSFAAALAMCALGFAFSYLAGTQTWVTDVALGQLGSGFLWASLAVPCILMVEFYRRMYLIHMQGQYAFGLSLLVNLLLWGGLGYLLATEALSVTASLLALSVSNAIPILFFLVREGKSRGDFVGLRESFQRNWKFGKFVFFSEALNFGRSNFVYWAILGVMGAGATGAYSACHSLMRVINPIFLGIAGVAEPSIAAGYARDGAAEVRKIAFRVLLFMVVGTLPICMGVGLFSETLLQLFFGGRFVGYGGVVGWLAAAGFFATASYPFSNAIQAVDRPDVNYRIRILTMALTIFGVLIALPIWGLVGAAVTHFACSLIALTLRVICFHHFTRRSSGPSSRLKVAGSETP